MAAIDDPNAQLYYHGTKADLKPGDLIAPGYDSNYGTPKTWYGMPAYAIGEGKVVCFYQSAQKFGARYATLGFSDTANLDEGSMWSTSFALTELTAAVETRISALVKKAVS